MPSLSEICIAATFSVPSGRVPRKLMIIPVKAIFRSGGMRYNWDAGIRTEYIKALPKLRRRRLLFPVRFLRLLPTAGRKPGYRGAFAFPHGKAYTKCRDGDSR